jgi:F-type H+-transporting ATPase subunit a
MFFVFKAVAKKYKLGAPAAPKGIASWMEPLVLFVRDFAKENIGDKKYMKFMPYLLTVFFFIWFGNLLGLIPFIGGINMTGNISITLTLALITLVIQMVNSKWAFWSHMLMPPGVPVLLYPILVPIELLGLIIKPAALMIRLFANITAGHVIVLSIIGIIFMNHSFAWAGLSVPLALFISVLEVTLVAFLQAYIFTMLSSMFIGSAVEEAHH